MKEFTPAPDSHAFGWVFLDVRLADSSHVTVAVHGANGFTYPRRSSVIVWRYAHGQAPRLWTVSGGDNRLPVAGPYCGMTNGAGRIVRSEKGWDVDVERDGLVVKASITNCAPPWRPSAVPFPLRHETEDASFDWVALCPYGEVEGYCVLGGEELRLDGTCYIDANFGSIDLGAKLDWWKWSCTELPDGSNLVVSATKWKEQPLVSAAIRMHTLGVETMAVDEVEERFGVDIGQLAIDSPENPSSTLEEVSYLPLKPLGAGIEGYRRWSGKIGTNSAVLALLKSAV